jgi:hypothetical protein
LQAGVVPNIEKIKPCFIVPLFAGEVLPHIVGVVAFRIRSSTCADIELFTEWQVIVT